MLPLTPVLLAQQTQLPDPNHYASLGWVLAILFGLGLGLLTWKQLLKREPSLTEEFVTRREYVALEAKHDRKFEEIVAQIEANTQAGEERVVKLHDRLNALPTEIINLLRKTKGLL